MRVISEELAHYLRNMENQPAAIELLGKVLRFPSTSLDIATLEEPSGNKGPVPLEYRIHLHLILARMLDLLDYLLECGCICIDACRLLVPAARIFRAMALSIHKYNLRMEYSRLVKIACMEMDLMSLTKTHHVSLFAQRAFVRYFHTSQYDKFSALHDCLFSPAWKREVVIVPAETLMNQPVEPDYDILLSVDQLEDNVAHYNQACQELTRMREVHLEDLTDETRTMWMSSLRDDSSLLNLSADVTVQQGAMNAAPAAAKKGDKTAKAKKITPETPATVAPIMQLIPTLVRGETQALASSLLQTIGNFRINMENINGILREECKLAHLMNKPDPLEEAVQAAEEAARERERAIQPLTVYSSLLPTPPRNASVVVKGQGR